MHAKANTGHFYTHLMFTIMFTLKYKLTGRMCQIYISHFMPFIGVNNAMISQNCRYITRDIPVFPEIDGTKLS